MSSRSVASSIRSDGDENNGNLATNRYESCSLRVDDSQGVVVALLGTTGVLISIDLIAGAVVGRVVLTGDEGI